MVDDENPIEIITKSRLEGLTEGVFAIVMTLLVFLIIAPEFVDDSGNTMLHIRAAELLPSIRAYASSFVVLGIFWVTHHAVFHYIQRLDGFIIWINIIFLMTVALVPLSTLMVVNYDPVPLALVFYGANMFAASVPLVLIWMYAARTGDMVHPDVDKATMRLVTLKTLAAPAIFMVATGVSYLDLHATRTIYFVAGAAYIVLTVILHKKRIQVKRSR
ncbi:MAG: DUF1211 domain-containing protein [Candidatus Coatesbacteria bacterium]|nr:MAG: DUF1211 domain-containing protein [Candidatus Coatesbacteria bacterium]